MEWQIDEIYKAVQEVARKNPLLLIGTGGSIPYGIPGMVELCEYLRKELTPRFGANPTWQSFMNELDNGAGLESALLKVTLPDNIQEDVLRATWDLVSRADLDLFRGLVTGAKHIALSDLLRFFYSATPQCVNIITTNYDRMVEYACDFAGLPVDTRMNGQYYRIQRQGNMKRLNTINLLKVHGSLDLFQDSLQRTFALPQQEKIPNGLIPRIITPGVTKYQNIFQAPYNDTLHNANSLIDSAQGYLCIGYGFNDDHIQEGMLRGAEQGKPILLITKTVSDSAAHLLVQRTKHYITISEGRTPGTSEVVIDRDVMEISGDLWKVEGLLKILQGE